MLTPRDGPTLPDSFTLSVNIAAVGAAYEIINIMIDKKIIEIKCSAY